MKYTGKSNDIQKKGVRGENWLIEIFKELLEEFSSISSLRRYESGSQLGKDVKAEAILRKNNFIGIITDEKIKWFFEVKNYQSKLYPNQLISKMYQLRASNAKIDCFCLFSPFQDLHGLFEDDLLNDKLIQLPDFPFKIVLWTPANMIKEKLRCLPEIYEKIYGEKIEIKKGEKEKIQEDWIKEIYDQSIEGKKIRKDFLEKWSGEKPIWVPESIEEAEKTILDSDGDLKPDIKKRGVLEKKLKCGGINCHQDILSAKRSRIRSEGTRRKYKKTNESMYVRLNALRIEIENFCLKLEKEIFSNNIKDEAEIFLEEFSLKIEKFKKDYSDVDLIQKLNTLPWYYKGQMYDITGECVLSLSKKWLKEFKNLVDEK